MPPNFQLHLITEPRHSSAAFLDEIEKAVRGGVDWVQLRDKQSSASNMYRLAVSLRDVTRRAGTRLSINDRLDVALAVGADGVHLAGQSLPVRPACQIAHPHLLVGRSVHGLDEALAAVAEGADYLTFGHVFPTSSKAGMTPRGPSELERIVQATTVPVLAIGGINLANLDDVLATGCAGIAVISAILSAENPQDAAASLRDALDRSQHRPSQAFPIISLAEECDAAHLESAAL